MFRKEGKKEVGEESRLHFPREKETGLTDVFPLNGPLYKVPPGP